MKTIALILFIALLTFSTVSFSQSPGVRNGHAMVYHTPSKSIMLFGGADEKKVYGDTWFFSKGNWKKLNGNGPSQRTFPCMVMADDYVLLFGGNAVLFGNEKNPVHHLDDTWKFQNGRWKKVNVAIHPTARAEAAVTYDPLRKKIVLFGGRLVGEKWIADDTWEFDGAKWKQMEKPGPTARSGAVMIYDREHKQVVLFGGNPVIAKEKNYNGPMWSWNGSEWNNMHSDASLVFNSCFAYNTKEHFMFRFGGWNGEKRLNDSWIYRNNGWKKLITEKSPPARNHSVMVYDPANNAFILYGGHDGDNVFGDMWSFKNGQWVLLFSVPAVRRVENGH